MAARFVVVLALIALCHSSPVLINGVEIRDGRSLSTANGFASNYGPGEIKATANAMNNIAQSSGVSSGDGLVYPGQGQAIANAQTINDNAAIELARLQGYYQPYAQPIPVAQPAYIAYNQVPAEQLIFPGAPATAKSSAITNEFAEKSESVVNSHGAGKANAHSQTAGSHGITTTNARTDFGYNSAASNADTNSGFASTSSLAGSGLGNDYAASNAQTNGEAIAPIPVAIPSEIEAQPAVIAVKNSGVYNPALYNSAASTANVKGFGAAQASANTATAPTRKSISWRFGTAYDIPAGYGSIKAAAPVAYQTPVVYQSTPIVYEATPSAFGNAKSSVNTRGSANGAASADITNYNSRAQSAANSAQSGNANSDAQINANVYRSAGTASGLKSSASTIGQGASGADANIINGNGISTSFGNSQGGRIQANADVLNNGYGLYRSGEVSPWSRTNAYIDVNGFGQAKSTAQEIHGMKRADSSASSNWGSSIASSQSL